MYFIRAKVARDYNYKIEEIDLLPLPDVLMLFECLGIMEHQEMLRDMTSSSFSDMNKERQKELHRNVYKAAFPATFRKEKRSLGPEELMRLING